jgi:hypothetical protein
VEEETGDGSQRSVLKKGSFKKNGVINLEKEKTAFTTYSEWMSPLTQTIRSMIDFTKSL